MRNFLQLPTSEEFDRSMFVPSDDPLLIHLLVAKATSFSVAIGGPMLDVVLPLFAKYPLAEPGAKLPCLYACENDHKVIKMEYISTILNPLNELLIYINFWARMSY